MCCSMWLNRGTALGLRHGVAIGVGAMALREPSKEQATHVPPKEEQKPGPKPPLIPQTQIDAAQLRCSTLNKVVQAYTLSPQNPGLDDNEKLPMKPEALVTVPFGGPSYIEGGKADLLEPWGKPYELKHAKRANGSTYVLIKTTAPDGTPIKQFGVGKTEEPK